MDLSRKWLNEFVDGVSVEEISDRAFAEAMTMSGSKVENIRDMSGEIRNVVVGRVMSLAKHPNSDHLLVVQLDVGKPEPVQICTGAWNIHDHDSVPVALDDSDLPGGIHITAGALRGVASAGMMCSLKELGLDTHNFPYGVIKAAALLNDYHPIDPAKPSISPDIKAGDKIFGHVYCAQAMEVDPVEYGRYLVRLSLGQREIQVITDCMNIHEGDLVAFNNPSETICTLADLRAEQKEFPHCIDDGIFLLNERCQPGDDIRTVLGLDDHVVEFEITPNRSDCLSMIGLAREAAVTFGKELKLHEPVVKGGAEGVLAEMVDIEVEEPELCPRYTARMVKNVKIGPSPKWMRDRISAMGMRPINNLVDITNYVMMEYGQPMHAFDFSCVKGGKLVVRKAREGEVLQTLDGNDRQLTPSMLCICDEERPIAVAGVMGGFNSEIVGDTAMVLFESANFNGTSVRRTAAALNMRTAASARYEKGLDPMMTYQAVNRACELVEMLGCGEVVDGVIDCICADSNPLVIPFRPDRVNWILGTDIDRATQQDILERLGFTVEGDQITVPSWRRDISPTYSDNDVAEEVARIYGFDNIPTTLMDSAATTVGGYTEEQKAERTMGAVCRSAGFDEVITYSFFSPSCFDKIRLPADSPLRDTIRILNPLGEDTSTMRTTTLPSMLEVLARNYNYRNPDVRLYEVGRTYFKRSEDNLSNEPKVLTMGAYGKTMNFYAMKGVVDAVCRELKVENLRYEADKTNPSYHPGRCANVWCGETLLGTVGQVHPLVARNYDVDDELYTAELSCDALMACRRTESFYQPLPKFPAVTRDISVICDKAITVGTLSDCIRRGAKGLLKDVTLFDIYQGAGIPEDKKSVAFSLTLRSDERSITSEEADEDVTGILALLKEELGAVLR